MLAKKEVSLFRWRLCKTKVPSSPPSPQVTKTEGTIAITLERHLRAMEKIPNYASIQCYHFSILPVCVCVCVITWILSVYSLVVIQSSQIPHWLFPPKEIQIPWPQATIVTTTETPNYDAREQNPQAKQPIEDTKQKTKQKNKTRLIRLGKKGKPRRKWKNEEPEDTRRDDKGNKQPDSVFLPHCAQN